MSNNSPLEAWRGNNVKHDLICFVAPGQGFPTELPDALAGFRIRSEFLDPSFAIPSNKIAASSALCVEVRPDQPNSMDRLTRLIAEAAGRPVIAAISSPTVPAVRAVMRAGAVDVVSLPLTRSELQPVLELVSQHVHERAAQQPRGRLITFIKSKGGIGGTTVVTQTAVALSQQVGHAALLDLDVQLGCAALYLGLAPKLTLADVLEAAERLDGGALKAAMVQHHSGVYVLAAPPETLPLDVLDSDKALAIVAASTQEFGTTLIDGPLDWTDWYMSILARSDEIIMLSDLSLAGLHNGRRRLDLLRQQGLDSIPLRLGLNMVQKSRFRSLSLKDAETALGRDVDFSIAQDTVNVAEALTRGETLHDLYPSSRAAKDLRAFAMTLIARDS